MSQRPWVVPMYVDIANGMSKRDAAKKYGVSERTIYRALYGRHDRKPHPIVLKPCGTQAAYRRHLRHDEVPCVPCSEANAAYEKDRSAA